ncbi:glycoside hydrolase family 43 protein [Actinoplanes sp. NEAU-A12]|uniref:Glycoside hydrolase family 43 protein n=1 Tax=Actinoplanes sandaracinus TaxID=3045177 RepID=A0ABT6WGN3_9ACTN|nr:glycoside hydrolase family 43 protein [Actinoplanes sandaracinus]MDI6098888.1 glycoside hydrolase family 43 protein [Actinoplanes sandaracinus]
MPLSRREFHRLAALGTLTAAAGGAAVLGAPPAALAADSAYVFGYFKETPNQSGDSYALHLAVSTDGLNWRPLNQNNPVATPTAGTLGLRDPFILRKRDGTFVVLATDLRGRIFTENNQYLHVWDSTDLRGFTGYRRIRMHGLATHTWAPTAFWVASRNQYAIVYSANNGADVFMVNYTSDFRTVSANQVYHSPGFPVLDADVVVDGSTFYMYYKNLADGLIYGARSSTGAPRSYTDYTGGLRQGGAIEAPMLVRNNTGSGWRLWGDSFSPVNNDYYAWSTSNVGGNAWTPLHQRDYTPPLNAKHGSIVGITSAEYDGLVSRWGLPAWVRLKSYNFPDRYVRHAGGIARIDAYPFDPHQDQLWRMVPGLADPAGVSFASINLPGRFLRHSDYAIRLDTDDGTATFRADATFTRVAGLADPTWSSWRSHNFPDRYLRHSGYVLRIDPLSAASSAADRQDATFRIS